MIQSKTKLLPSNRELAQMCSRAGISDAQEFFPADSGGFNSVYRVSTAAHGIFILKMSPRYGAPVLTHERNMMHTELTAYDLIRSHTSIRVPRVIFSDFSGKCWGCGALRGKSPCATALPGIQHNAGRGWRNARCASPGAVGLGRAGYLCGI